MTPADMLTRPEEMYSALSPSNFKYTASTFKGRYMCLAPLQSYQLDVLFVTLCYLPGYALLAITCSIRSEKMLTIMAVAYGGMFVPLQVTEYLNPDDFPVWFVSVIAGLVCLWHLAGYLIIAATEDFRRMLNRVLLTGSITTLLAAVTHLSLRLASG